MSLKKDNEMMAHLYTEGVGEDGYIDEEGLVKYALEDDEVSVVAEWEDDSVYNTSRMGVVEINNDSDIAGNWYIIDWEDVDGIYGRISDEYKDLNKIEQVGEKTGSLVQDGGSYWYRMDAAPDELINFVNTICSEVFSTETLVRPYV